MGHWGNIENKDRMYWTLSSDLKYESLCEYTEEECRSIADEISQYILERHDYEHSCNLCDSEDNLVDKITEAVISNRIAVILDGHFYGCRIVGVSDYYCMGEGERHTGKACTYILPDGKFHKTSSSYWDHSQVPHSFLWDISEEYTEYRLMKR